MPASPAISSSDQSPRFHYAWVVVAMTFVILLVSAGVRAVPAVLMLPLEQEFGWVRTTTSAALSVNILLYGLTGPFAGSLMARVGVRRVVLSALVLLDCGPTAPTMESGSESNRIGVRLLWNRGQSPLGIGVIWKRNLTPICAHPASRWAHWPFCAVRRRRATSGSCSSPSSSAAPRRTV